MKILVTGGAGFIGSHLSQKLISAGHKVTIADIFTSFTQFDYNANFFYRKKLIKEAKLYNLKSSHPDVWKNSYDVVVHLAGIPVTNPKKGSFLKDNIQETEKTLRLAQKTGVKKFIFMSSIYAYGPYLGKPYKEDMVLSPQDGYSISKAVGEYLTRFYFSEREWIIVRTAGVYGFGDHNPRITRLIVELHNEIPNFALTQGVQRNFIYIDDLANGLLKAVQSNVSGEAFNMVTETTSILNFATWVKKHINNLSWELRECPKDELIIGPADISKAKKLLNFKPEYPLSSGIANYINILKTFS